MKNSIGGVFRRRDDAAQAYHALQKAGFNGQDLMLLSRKQAGWFGDRASGQAVLIGAIIGGAVGGGVALILGTLIGLGVIDVPGFIPNLAPGGGLELLTLGFFILQGIVTGAILGVAIRLFTTRREIKIVKAGITGSGPLVVVNAEEAQQDMVTRLMQETGAIDIQNLSERWDQEVWSGFNKLQPPSLN